MPNHDRRDAAIVAAMTVLATLTAWPFAATPFDDDASYALTVRQLLRTGHLTYNGWATAASIAHAYWALPWVWAMGFSFDALRLSTLPLAGGAVALAHLLARRAGLRPSFAALAALTLGLSPLMLPLSASFMTDVPGLFYTLLSLYGLTRAVDAPARRSALAWLAVGVLAGAVGGTARQIVWGVPLALLPYLAWVRRRDWPVMAFAFAGWVATIAVAAATLAWFARQPYALAEPPLGSDLSQAVHHARPFVGRVLALVPTTMVLVLPAVGLTGGWRRWSAALAGGLMLVSAAFLFHWRDVAIGPWMHNILTTRGILGIVEIAGPRPITLPHRLCVLLSVLTFAALSAAVARIVAWVVDRRRAPGVHPGLLPERHARAMLALFAAGYVALLLPRCARPDASFDRYVLPLLPCAAVPMLLAAQAYRRRPSPLAWGLLALWAGYAIATTQELWAMNRARATAAAELNGEGVAPTNITAGFDVDLWTELDAAGHLNSNRIKNPPGAFRPGVGLTPSIHPIFRLELGPTDQTVPTTYPPVEFTTVLPPFHRKVYIDRLRRGAIQGPTPG
jgi:hypothetical protein